MVIRRIDEINLHKLVELVVVTSEAFLPLTCTEPTFSQQVSSLFLLYHRIWCSQNFNHHLLSACMSSNRILDGEPRPKRRRILPKKALEGDELSRGTASQPIELPETQFTTQPSQPSLPEPAERPCVPTKSTDNPDVGIPSRVLLG